MLIPHDKCALYTYYVYQKNTFLTYQILFSNTKSVTKSATRVYMNKIRSDWKKNQPHLSTKDLSFKKYPPPPSIIIVWFLTLPYELDQLIISIERFEPTQLKYCIVQLASSLEFIREEWFQS